MAEFFYWLMTKVELVANTIFALVYGKSVDDLVFVLTAIVTMFVVVSLLKTLVNIAKKLAKTVARLNTWGSNMRAKFFLKLGERESESVIFKTKIVLAVFALLLFVVWIIGIYFSQLSIPSRDEYIKSSSNLPSVHIKAEETNVEERTRAELGQMGDFFGGMLNPLLAFASFIALLYTIRIQSRELEMSTLELKNAAIAQRESSDALQKQVSHIEKQNFENIFFKMLNNLTNLSILLDDNKAGIDSILNFQKQLTGADSPDGTYDNRESWRWAKECLEDKVPRFKQFAKNIEIMLRFLVTETPSGMQQNTFVQESHRFYFELMVNAIGSEKLTVLIVYCSNQNTPNRLLRLIEHCSFFESLDISYDGFLSNSVLKISESGIKRRAFSLDIHIN